MVRHSNAEEGLDLASDLSQLSIDAIDEQVAELHPRGSTLVGNGTHLAASFGDRDEEFARALSSLQKSVGAVYEQIARLHPTGSASAHDEAHLNLSPNENDEDRLQLAQNLHRQASGIINQLAAERDRKREAGTVLGSSVPTTLIALSRLEVRT
jgi:hypothetical protein